MPQNVRNFWITLDIDGRKTRIATGPIRRNGGFSLDVGLREKGSISSKALEVHGLAVEDGKRLVLWVIPKGGLELVRVEDEGLRAEVTS